MNATTNLLDLAEAGELIAQEPLVKHLPAVVASVIDHWAIGDADTLARIVEAVTDLANGLDARDLDDVTGAELMAWCHRGPDRRFERHERRAALYIARSVLEPHTTAKLGPDTLKIALEPLAPGHKNRPLLRSEHAAVRAAAHRFRTGAHRGADNEIRLRIVAIGEAGAVTNEIAQVFPPDVRRGNAKVILAGSRDTERREVTLTAWGRAHIFAALDGHDPSQPLAYGGGQRGPGKSAAASPSGIGRRLLNEAGLVDGDATLTSLRNTAAVRAWNGRDLQPVLEVLGLTTKHRVDTAWKIVHTLET